MRRGDGSGRRSWPISKYHPGRYTLEKLQSDPDSNSVQVQAYKEESQ